MFASFLTVGKQVISLAILIAVGFAMGKAKLLSSQGSASMSNLIMYIVTPCILISSFQIDMVPEEVKNFFVAAALSLLIHLISIFLTKLLIREPDNSKNGILRFSAVFGNYGFMGYPLLTAIVGSMGIFYGSSMVIVLNILAWTWGVLVLQKTPTKLSWKPIIMNPGVLGCGLALVLYLLQIKLPPLLLTPVDYLSSLNTPLPMVIVGYQLSQADFRAVLKLPSTWTACGIRMILMPLAAALICRLLHIDSTVATVLIVSSATPAASMLSMLAVKCDTDTSLASGLVSFQTALSVLTMPVMITLAQSIL